MTGDRDGCRGARDQTRGAPAGEWLARDVLDHRVTATPDRTALVDVTDGTEWSYRDLDRVVGRLASDLGAGGPVGTLLDTRVAFVALVHAAMRRGRPLAVLNTQLPADTLADQARRAGVDLVVCDRDTEQTARQAAPSPVASLDEPAAEDVARLDPETDGEDGGERGGADADPLDPTETAVVVFTSGTTGTPKGVRLTVRNLVSSAVASAFRLGVDTTDRWLCCLPMYHMGGFAPVVRCALYGTALAVQPGFDADRTATVIDEFGVTGVSLVPTQLRRLLERGWEPPASLDAVLLGGAPAAPDLVERAVDRGVPVYPTYGTTETASQVATARPREAVEYPGTVGQPLVATDVTVLSGGEPADAGEVGEVVVAGPTVTPGYLDDDRTAAAVGEYGFHTGDLGYRDRDGRLWIEGRVDDAITTGGETVYPTTVADALRAHPAVADAAVLGLPDEEWGERVAALVAVDGSGEGEGVDGEALRDFCRGRVAEYAVPKTVAVADSIPRTPSGTVDREAVRERLDAER